MGQKSNPIGLRLGITRTWESRWFLSKSFRDSLIEDRKIRKYITNRVANAGISKVEIDKSTNRISLIIFTSRPGVIIGKKGKEVDKLRDELQHVFKGKDIQINISEVNKPEIDAMLVAENIARQIEQRVNYRRVMKKAIQLALTSGAEGIKIMCGGRLAGAEIARTEHYHQGRVPLQTLRADIDFAKATAVTTYGCIGIKVWICKGEIIKRSESGNYPQSSVK
ncbi:MAG: 30S ribosomal protein S3 [Candidatus Delongbacteria bacterium]|nr:30S ribosomal protein S3 [Candidatus Delongbacteria bacterium]